MTECFAAVESFIARRLITGEETKEYNKFFVEVIGSLRGVSGADVLPALKRKLMAGGGTTRHWPADGEVIEKAISRQLFSVLKTPALRLILERLEIALRSKKTENMDIPAGLQIEHVLPQKWAARWPLHGKLIPDDVVQMPFRARDELAGLNDAIRARNGILQTLGNLTLLNKHLNPAASNAAFEVKVVEYKNSVLRLNRHFDATSAWDEKSIAMRGRYLGELACKVWPRPAES
jgi:hypothetical protein